MATSDKITNETPSPEFPRGTAGACTPEDRAALFELYRAVYPNATTADLMADVRNAETQAWAAYRDQQGEIRIAMFVQQDGICWLFVRPTDCDSLEIKRGFLMLTEHVYKVLQPSGIKYLAIMHAASINRLGDSLEKESVLGKAFIVVRIMHFADQGKVARVN